MWDLNDINSPEPEAVQAEREIVEEIVRNERPTLHDRLHAAAVREAERDNERYLVERDGPADTGTVKFKRLRNGSWGITGPSDLLRTDALVAVTKRDGSVTTVRCGKVVWRGDGRAIAATRRA